LAPVILSNSFPARVILSADRIDLEEELTMTNADRLRYLRVALVLVGVIFVFGIYPLGMVWPSGWQWGVGHSHYHMMIIGVYATLGVFLLMAAKNPAAHTSLIWFTIWSSIVHAGIMGAQSLADAKERGHLLGDVPALLVVAVVLAVLTPRAEH
jgi:hypothetical protein